MAVTEILGFVLILLVKGTKAYAICYHYDSRYGNLEYTGYCYQGCCSSQCCENTTETPELDDVNVTAIIIGCVLGFALFVAIVIIIGICCYYKLKTKSQIQGGQVLTTTQTYPLMFQGAYPNSLPGHLSQLTNNHTLGASYSPSHANDTGIEMTQYPNGHRNDTPGNHSELGKSRIDHQRQSDPPAYEPLPDTSNETTLSTHTVDVKF